MKTKELFRKAMFISLALSAIMADSFSQPGTQYDAGFFLSPNHYGRLRTSVFLPNLRNIKALGVYQNSTILPNSALEVNTQFSHIPATQTLFYGRGEVFRTNCPSGVTSNWRMLRGGFEVGRLFNNSGSNDFNLQASEGNLIFQAPNGKVIVQDELVLKAAGTEKYYTLTVNKRGKLKAKRINLETVEPEKIVASN